MPNPEVVDMVWDDLNRQIAEINARLNTLEVRTERSETTSGHPTATVATVPLAGEGVKGGDELWLSDGLKPGESVGTGIIAYYDPATDSWIPIGIFPRRWEGLHLNSVALTGGSVVIGSITAGQIMVHFARQNPAANADSFTQSVFLMAGTYTFNIIGNGQADGGLLDWYLDGVLIAAGDDFYTAAATNNLTFTHTVVVPTSGYHVLKGLVVGNTAPSTGFVIRITTLAFIPNAD